MLPYESLHHIEIYVMNFQPEILSAPNAYLDPGSGSFILQLVLAAILEGLFIIKGYWMKIKGLFTKGADNPEIEEDQQEKP
jgi:hypothetical protein